MITLRSALIACSAAILAACGSDSTTGTGATSTARGTLQESPPLRIASVDAPTLKAQLGATASGAQPPQYGQAPVRRRFLRPRVLDRRQRRGDDRVFGRTDGAYRGGAAVLGSAPDPAVCPRHPDDKSANIADITNPSNSEGALVAAMFAAQGYIVVAPNYAGYDISTLGYHPFLYATQQSGEMIDALTAARTALPSTSASGTTDNGELFITGYSEGGHVAMATASGTTR